RRAQPSLEQLERREVMSQTTFHLDLGTSSSPVASGYQRVPLVNYSAAQGFGWQSTSGLSAVNRNGSALTRDFHSGPSGTFLVDLPNGTYNVTLTMGDAKATHDHVNVSAEGASVVSNLTTLAGQFAQPTFQVTVADGQLTLDLVDTGGSGSTFALNGIDITPVGTNAVVANAGADQTAKEGAAVQFSGSASS